MLKRYCYANTLEAGLDEAGRGCLAGPVVAAAVILPNDYHNSLLNDSKKLSPKTRLLLEQDIKNNALAYAIAEVSNIEIDLINILQASIKAMHIAVGQLNIQPEHLLIDGNRFNNYPMIPHTCVVKGDSKLMSIAAASILAKTHRDALMNKLHLLHQEYAWDINKGYPTIMHRKAIIEHGITHFHRKTFKVKAT